jgi:cellulose biosynthesis protein BcsQ
VTAGLTHRDDLSGYAAMVQEIRRLEIEPAGVVLNRFIPRDVYSEAALEAARQIFEAVKVPELGVIRERQTMKSSRRVHEWVAAESGPAVGLYIAQEEPRLNEATRAGITHTIQEIEYAANAVVQAIAANEAKTASALEV